jgi:hypothetical protein
MRILWNLQFCQATSIFEFQFTIKSGIGPTISKKNINKKLWNFFLNKEISNFKQTKRHREQQLNNSQNSPPFAAGVE